MSGFGTDAHAVKFGVPCTTNGYGVEITPTQGVVKCYVNGETVNTTGGILMLGVFGDFKATICSSPDGKNPIKTISGVPKNPQSGYVDFDAIEPKIKASDVQSIIIIGKRPEFPPQNKPPENKPENKPESPNSVSPTMIGIIIGVIVLVIGIGVGIYLYRKRKLRKVDTSSESSMGDYYKIRY